MGLEETANRIREKASNHGDEKERKRLLLLAECISPSDPVLQMADRMEREEVASRYPQTLGRLMERDYPQRSADIASPLPEGERRRRFVVRLRKPTA